MAVYHINGNNQGKICTAQPGNCPFGSSEEHYPTLEQAESVAQERLEQKYSSFGVVKSPHIITGNSLYYTPVNGAEVFFYDEDGNEIDIDDIENVSISSMNYVNGELVAITKKMDKDTAELNESEVLNFQTLQEMDLGNMNLKVNSVIHRTPRGVPQPTRMTQPPNHYEVVRLDVVENEQNKKPELLAVLKEIRKV